MSLSHRMTRPLNISLLDLLKTALVALLIILVFSFLPSKFPSNDTPPQETASDATSAVITSPTGFAHIKVKNFGQMDEHFFRGAQPKPNDYKALAALGIKLIIDLRDDPTRYEKSKAEAAGMRYVNIPMNDKAKPSEDQIAAFFDLADNPLNQPFYVHCAGGRHRTGLIGAVYRFEKYGWDFTRAFIEMKNYDYYSRWGHGAIKEYVEEYYERVKDMKEVAPVINLKAEAPPSEPATAPPPPKPKE